ncbi:MAG: sulfotransferase [Desulfobacteraceae bacterium]|nr:sulfotransferase [Desulfobacteraceae bacterium]
MKKPNFFIIGAPKCGTTALAQWLGEHPNIYISPVKEPHFYSTDIANRQTTRKEYDRLFRNAGEEHQAVGESSVWYLYSEKAVPNILKEIPEAKFVVCLRNPVEMAYSLHGQHLVANNETLQDFDNAWAAQAKRWQGESVPKLCVDPQLLLYGPACKLGSQLQRLYRRVNADNIHLVFLDDMKTDARMVYCGVLEFLGIPDDGKGTFPVVNPASERLSPALAMVIKAMNLACKKAGLPRLGTGIMPLLNRLNRKKSERAGMSDAMRKKLQSYFEEDIKKIEKLTGRSLYHWRK